MFLPRPLRKWAAVLRGDAAPGLILLSVACGLSFGLTPGFYGVHLTLLLLVLVLNVHLGLFLMTAAIGRSLAWAAAPLLYHLGVWLHGHGSFPAGLLSRIPLVAASDFSRYSLLAGLLFGPLLGLIAGCALAWSVRSYRLAWLKLEEGSESFRRFQASRWVRLLEWLLLGARADVRAVLHQRARYVRMPGVIVAFAVLLVFAGGSLLLAGRNLGPLLARQLGQINGAEVNVGLAQANLLTGRVRLENVACTDPQRPGQNRLAVGRADAQLRLASLLFGRIVLERVVAADVAFDQPRARPGRVFQTRRPTEPPVFDATEFSLPGPDVARLERYVRNAGAIREQLARLERWLPKRSAARPRATRPPRSYPGYLFARAADPPVPKLILRTLRLDPVNIPAPGFGAATLVASNFSDAPTALSEPLRVEIRSRQSGGVVTAVAKLAATTPEAALRGELPRLDLRQLQQRLRDDNPLTFESGTADVRIEGTIRDRQIDATLNVKMTGLKVRAGGSRIFGLKPDVARQALDAIETLEVPLRVVGPLGEPRIAVDATAVQRQLRDALVSAGKAELARQVDALLADRLPAGVPDAKQMIRDPANAIQQGVRKGFKEGIGSLIGGNDPEEKNGENGEEKPKKEQNKARRTIEDLRKKLGKP